MSSKAKDGSSDTISIREKFIYSPIFETEEQCITHPFHFHDNNLMGREADEYDDALMSGFLLNL